MKVIDGCLRRGSLAGPQPPDQVVCRVANPAVFVCDHTVDDG